MLSMGEETQVIIKWRNMAKDFWYGLLSGIFGLAVSILTVATILRFDWKDKESVIIIATQGIIGLVIIFVTHSNKIKREERMEIDKKIDSKADIKDIEKIQCQIDVMHQTIEHVAKSQEKERVTIEKIYDLLLKDRD